MEFGRLPSRSASLGGASTMNEGAVAGAPAGLGQELASPPPIEALEAMQALVAAAGYAGTHGTPAIQAALASAGMLDAGAMPLPKRQRTDGAADIGALLAQAEQAALLARRASAGQAQQAGGGGGGLEGWQPAGTHTLMLRTINRVLAGHEWGPQEQADCVRFRWALADALL